MKTNLAELELSAFGTDKLTLTFWALVKLLFGSMVEVGPLQVRRKRL